MCNTKSSGLFDDILADPNFGTVLPEYSITDGNLQVNVAFLDYDDADNPSFASKVRVSIVEDNLGLLEDANRFDYDTKPVVYWDIKPTSFELFDDLLKRPGQILSKGFIGFGMSPEDVRGETHEGLPYLLTWIHNKTLAGENNDLRSYVSGPNFLHCSTDVDDSEFILLEHNYPLSPMNLNTEPWEFKDKSQPFHYYREFGQTIVELYVGGIDDGSTENGISFGLGSKANYVQAYLDFPLDIPDKDECIKKGNRLAHVLKDKGFVPFLQEVLNRFGCLYFDATC